MTTRKLEGKVIKGFGQWAVTTYGLECTEQSYFIDKTDLAERHRTKTDVNAFYTQVMNKTWVNAPEFTEAYKFALSHHNVEGGELRVLAGWDN